MNEKSSYNSKSEFNSNKQIQTIIESALKPVEVNINALKLRNAHPLYDQKKTIGTASDSPYLLTFSNQYETLFSPFKKYNNWQAYGFTFERSTENQTQSEEIIVHRNKLTHIIKKNGKSITTTIYFKRLQVRQNEKWLNSEKTDLAIKAIMKSIKESELLNRVPFYEEKEK